MYQVEALNCNTAGTLTCSPTATAPCRSALNTIDRLNEDAYAIQDGLALAVTDGLGSTVSHCQVRPPHRHALDPSSPAARNHNHQVSSTFSCDSQPCERISVASEQSWHRIFPK